MDKQDVRRIFHLSNIDSLTEQYFNSILKHIKTYDNAVPGFFKEGDQLTVRKGNTPSVWGYMLVEAEGKTYPVRVQCIATEAELHLWMTDVSRKYLPENSPFPYLGQKLDEISAGLKNNLVLKTRGVKNIEAYR